MGGKATRAEWDKGMAREIASAISVLIEKMHQAEAAGLTAHVAVGGMYWDVAGLRVYRNGKKTGKLILERNWPRPTA